MLTTLSVSDWQHMLLAVMSVRYRYGLSVFCHNQWLQSLSYGVWPVCAGFTHSGSRPWYSSNHNPLSDDESVTCRPASFADQLWHCSCERDVTLNSKNCHSVKVRWNLCNAQVLHQNGIMLCTTVQLAGNINRYLILWLYCWSSNHWQWCCVRLT